MSEYFSFNYLPDIRGVSISGGVVNTEDQSPAPLTGLHFSLLGKQPDYLAVLSDEQGRFVLTIPERIGIQEFFVAYDPSDEIKREIRIDQKFSELRSKGLKAFLGATTKMDVIVSGGISSIEDIKALKKLAIKNLTGIIVGKALYEGRIDLREALKC